MSDKVTRDAIDEARQRKRAFDEMSPKLRDLAQKVDEKLNGEIRRKVLVAYGIGELLLRVGAKNGIFDAHPMDLIAQYTQIPGGERTLASYRQMAANLDREFVEQQLKEPMRDGRLLSVSHFVEIATIKEPQKRLEILDLIRKKCISVADLRDQLVSCGLRSVAKKGGGRKARRPITPTAGLHRLSAHAQRITEYVGYLDAAFFANIAEMPPGEVDKQLLAEVEAAQTSTTSAIESLTAIASQLGPAKARVQRVLAAKKNRPQPQPA